MNMKQGIDLLTKKNKDMKKLLIMLGIAMGLVACSNNNSQELKPISNGCNTKIANYLYGIEYDDYDFDLCVNTLNSYQPPIGACSEVRKGNFIGRNLDWYINCDASAIIKINANEKRYASIGMIGCLPAFDNELASSGKYNDLYEILPAFTVDGINEKGLYAGVNVTSTGETSFDQKNWEPGKWGHGASFTNQDCDTTLCVMYLVRIMLDNAASVDEAKQIIRHFNWYEPWGFPHEGETQAFHWLISDSRKSMVVEFLDNEPVFTETTDITTPSYATIMTNFTNKLMADEGLIQNHGAGYERWDILRDNYDQTGESFEGMQNLMKKVWYSIAYTTPIGSKDFWLTDFATDEFPASKIYKNQATWNNDDFTAYIKHCQDTFADKSKWHHPETTLWYTTHTSVYSICDRQLEVLVHEGFDEQKTFFHIDFNTSFVKPLEHK